MLDVKPVNGRVIMPEVSLDTVMPAAGAKVPDNKYYRRLLRLGDIQPNASRKRKTSKKSAKD